MNTDPVDMSRDEKSSELPLKPPQPTNAEGCRREFPHFRLLVLIWMAVQSSVHSLLIHYSRVRNVRELFFSSVAVFCTEAMKAAVCLVMVYAESDGFSSCLRQMKKQILCSPRDTLKVCIPAMLYVVQNNLFYIAASHLDSATFMVFSQLKIFSTAIFAMLLMKYYLNWCQWYSLAILFIGVCLIQSHPTNAAHANSHIGIVPVGQQKDQRIGFMAVCGACAISGFAGVYFERILKGSEPVSIWMRNVQMSVFSLPLALFAVILQDREAIAKRGFFYGFDWVVWTVVFFYCVGGLSVALCIKYADNISKNFATSSAIILSTIGSIYLFDFKPNLEFVIGAMMVVLSIFLYSCSANPAPAAHAKRCSTSAVEADGKAAGLYEREISSAMDP